MKSVKLVRAYFDRVIEVNPFIHAVVEDRFQKALAEAKRVDKLIARTSNAALPTLFKRLKLLGVPFTVKESCGLKGTLLTTNTGQLESNRTTFQICLSVLVAVSAPM